MGLVDNWLEGIGLGYAVPIFSAQGISSPDTLSKLSVIDFPELGISDPNDRKKVCVCVFRSLHLVGLGVTVCLNDSTRYG